MANPRGIFTFATNATRTFGTGSQTGNFYNPYAAFLLGLVGNAEQELSVQHFTSNESSTRCIFRDRWTLNPKLTLDLGLRWEYYPSCGAQDRGIEMLDLNTLEMILGGVAGNPKNMGLVAPKDTLLREPASSTASTTRRWSGPAMASRYPLNLGSRAHWAATSVIPRSSTRRSSLLPRRLSSGGTERSIRASRASRTRT